MMSGELSGGGRDAHMNKFVFVGFVVEESEENPGDSLSIQVEIRGFTRPPRPFSRNEMD